MNNTNLFKWYLDLPEKYKYPAGISDIIRVVLMYKYGGMYCDLDIIILRNFLPILPDEFTATILNERTTEFLNSLKNYS